MSSYKNVIKSHRRKYKERSQPENRKRFGLLEKHSDYVERAKDYHKKEDTIQKLNQKAAFRNPDEFYFKMDKVKKTDGVYKLEDEEKRYKKKELLNMKTEDLAYLNLRKKMESQKVEKLQSSLHLLEEDTEEELKNQHIVFVDTVEDAVNFDEEKHFNTPKEFMTQTYNRPTNSMINDGSIFVNNKSIKMKDLKKLEKSRDAKYKELVARANRETKLKGEIQSMDLKRNLIKNPNVVKLKRGGRVVYKWRTERSK